MTVSIKSLDSKQWNVLVDADCETALESKKLQTVQGEFNATLTVENGEVLIIAGLVQPRYSSKEAILRFNFGFHVPKVGIYNQSYM